MPEQRLLAFDLRAARAAPLDDLILGLVGKTLASAATDTLVIMTLILFLVHV